MPVIRHEDRDRGGVAVMMAVITIILCGVASLVVDLGQMYTVRRAAQTAADMAALAGAQDLPQNPRVACQRAVDYLKANPPSPNPPPDEDLNLVLDSNECDPQTGDLPGVIDINGTRISVVVPDQTVQFGLVGALNAIPGAAVPTQGKVSAAATAEVRSPSKVLPFFLPVQCSLGSQVMKEDSQSTGPVTEPTAVFNPSSAGTGQAPGVDSVTAAKTPEGVALPTAVVAGTKFAAAGMTVDFTRGTVRHTATPTTVTKGDGNNWSLTVAVPGGVTSTPGVWYVRVMTSAGWSGDSNAKTLTITDVNTPITGCGQKETGDFGMLDSPRLDANGNQTRLDRNIALGLDHDVDLFRESLTPPVVLPPNTLDRNCQGAGNSPIPGGVYDDDPNRAAQELPNPPALPNCLDINNGNRVPAATDGLVKGGSGFDGRLTGRTATTDACPGPPGSTNPRTFMGETITNEVIGCYIRPGYTLGQLVSANPPADMLKAEIFESPRFFYIPIINAAFNPSNGWYPIVEFRGVFLTDESVNTPATANNGLATRGTKLTQIQVIAFKLEALPNAAAGSGNGGRYVGGTKAVRLIE